MKQLIILSILIKVFFTLFVSYDIYNHKDHFSIDMKSKYFCNNDEDLIANIAHTLVKTNQFRSTNINYSTNEIYYKKTTFCPVFPVYIHVGFMYLYEFLTKKTLSAVDIFNWENPDRNSHYFYCYSIFITILSLILFIASIFPFIRLIKHCGIEHKTLRTSIAILYILFPSCFIYVGLLTQYENIALPCLIITIESIINVFILRKVESKIVLFIKTLLIVFSTLIRPQVTIVLFIVMLFVVLLLVTDYLKNKMRPTISATYLILYISVGIIISHGSIVLHNYFKVWDEPVYNTRGDALLIGHNPLAKGSWDGHFAIPGSKSYNYQLKSIPNFINLSEVELSKAQTKLAKQWIISNPKEELILICRKIGIFFLPYNYEHLRFDIILFLVYISTIFLMSYSFYKIIFKLRTMNFREPVFLIQIVVLSVLSINVLYFVEYRIRYFADPFMLLLFGVLLQNLIIYAETNFSKK